MPSGGRYVLLALLDGFIGAQLLLAGLAASLAPQQLALAAGVWFLATAATDAVPYLGIMWLRGPGRDLVALAAWRSWATFYGMLALLAALGATGRSLLAPFLLGDLLPVGAALALGLNKTISSLIVAAAAERHAAFRRDAASREARLADLASQLQRSRSDLVAIGDKVRSDLAASLHGEVQGALLLASIRLSGASAARTAGDARHLVAESQQWLDRARLLVSKGAERLDDRTASTRELAREMRALSEAFSCVLPISLEVCPGFESAPARMEPTALQMGLRLVQEAVLNALRHGRPRRLRLSALPAEGGQIVIHVHDDGRGFQVDNVARGLGLDGFGGELTAAGGSWAIESRPGTGTRVEIRLPVESA